MSEIQNNANTYEDEIDLRELIMALWRSKYIIISIAIIAAILTGYTVCLCCRLCTDKAGY